MPEEKKKILILIYGQPGHGKSTLGEWLVRKAKFRTLHLDSIYEFFVKQNYPEKDIPNLGRCLGPHFDAILEEKKYGEEFADSYKDAWINHLKEVIKKCLNQHPYLAVEGYYLRDGLRKPIVKTFQDECTIYEMNVVRLIRDPSGKEIDPKKFLQLLHEEAN